MIDKEFLDTIMDNRNPKESVLDDQKKIILVPKGMEPTSIKRYLDEYRTKPERRKGTVHVNDLESFISLTNRYKSVDSVIFTNGAFGETSFSGKLRGILNYHPAKPENEAAENCDHSVEYAFPLSEELKTWLSKNKATFNSREFAEFLDDHNADMVVPDVTRFVTGWGENPAPAFASPSKILELSRGIEVRVDEKMTNAYRVSDGQFALQYTTENKDASGQPLKLPEWFALGIPVFENGEAYQFPMRLRFRAKDGAVTWFYEMYRKNDIFRAAFSKDTKAAAEATALPIFNGNG